ncbi:hypothetical protein F5884DRAFT_780354 [Xylogone sp. PMI_703]|nr:hypothetical protein F5884DRAFT_780354 [Xylogone sp. PMI_703]
MPYQALQDKYHIVHVANCDSIEGVKYVLSSFIREPDILITTSEWFAEEQEEIRSIAGRVAPHVKVIDIPPGLAEQEGTNKAVEYLQEQVVASGKLH